MDAGPYTFLAADALVLKVRESGRTVNVHALLATAVNADGYREILGLHVTSAEDGAGWLAFFRDLTARGLSGVALVGGGLCQAMARACLVRPFVCGPVGFVSPTVSRWWMALAPTLTVCDLLIMIMGQLASFGLPFGEGPAAKLGTA